MLRLFRDILNFNLGCDISRKLRLWDVIIIQFSIMGYFEESTLGYGKFIVILFTFIYLFIFLFTINV